MFHVRGPVPLLAVPNVSAHQSTASVPITVLLYNDPLRYGFNVPIKGYLLDSNCEISGIAVSYRLRMPYLVTDSEMHGS